MSTKKKQSKRDSKGKFTTVDCGDVDKDYSISLGELPENLAKAVSVCIAHKKKGLPMPNMNPDAVTRAILNQLGVIIKSDEQIRIARLLELCKAYRDKANQIDAAYDRAAQYSSKVINGKKDEIEALKKKLRRSVDRNILISAISVVVFISFISMLLTYIF